MKVKMFGHPKDNFLPKKSGWILKYISASPNNPKWGWGKKAPFWIAHHVPTYFIASFKLSIYRQDFVGERGIPVLIGTGYVMLM